MLYSTYFEDKVAVINDWERPFSHSFSVLALGMGIRTSRITIGATM